MVDLFDKITNIGKFYSKKFEHKVTDREEFKVVRDALVKYGMNVSFFDRNLRDLTIKESNEGQFVMGSYNARTNSIMLSDDKYSFVHELFHMASNNSDNKNELMGVLQKDNRGYLFGSGFNEGITDYFTHLVYPEYEPAYPFEEKIISIISETFGIKSFANHFNADPKEFYNYFGRDMLFVMEISKHLDEYNKSLYNLLSIIDRNNIIEITKNYDFLVEKISNSITKVCDKLYELLELKGVDTQKYKDEISNLFNGNNPNITQLRSLLNANGRVL